MFFTREDIEKIHQGLLRLGIKDSELPETINVNSDDTLAIVQDGKNKKINIEEFFNNISLFKKEGFINITDRFNKHSISLIEAIQTVPTHQRIDGLVITFEDINGDWRIYQFRGDAVDFFDENKWTDLYDYTNYIVKSITPDEEDLTVSKPDKNGNAIVSLKDRVYDESNFSGKGYKILRKNIQTIDGVRKNILTQDMINNPDTIYEIRYNFDLNGAEITVPENCILKFEGGSLHNGTLVSNNTTIENCQNNVFNNISFKNSWNISYLSYKFFNNYTNDTELLRAIFDLGLNGKNKCVIDLESRQYDVFSKSLAVYADSIYKYTESMNKTIHGNNAVINDKRTRTQINRGNYDGVIGFDSSHNISILNLNYQNVNEDFDINTDLGYKGSSFLILHNDCSNFNITSNIKGARYGIKSGDFSKYWLCGKYGIKDSTFNITASRCGYPVAIEVGDNLDISIVSQTHHRAAYLCGISNSKIRIKAKDIYIAPFHCLLSDSRYSNVQGEPHFKSCYNLDVVVHDFGTTVATASDPYLVTLQTYNQFTERTDPLIWNNINILCIKETQADKIGLFAFTKSNNNVAPFNIKDVYSNITIRAIDLNPSVQHSARISPSEYSAYSNITFEIIAPLQNLFWDNRSKDKFVLQNSTLGRIFMAGNITINNSIIKDWVKLKSNTGVDWYKADITNSEVLVTNNEVDSINTDFNSLTYSPPSTTPPGINKGLIVFDTVLKIAKIWNGSQWSFYDGLSVKAKRSGIFAEKPTDAQGISIGFAYFCTDKQSIEGATNGIMIYYKGNNTWVDSLGRTIS